MPKPKYPHMREWEEQIMDRFLQKQGNMGTFSYDIHLKVRDNPDTIGLSDNEKQLWRQMTAKRIDVLIETPTTIYLCEIKDRLRPSALGQVISYKHLYEEQFRPTKPVIGAIITEFDDMDMRAVCKAQGIVIWVV